jgi:hypothetical protein
LQLQVYNIRVLDGPLVGSDCVLHRRHPVLVIFLFSVVLGSSLISDLLGSVCMSFVVP